MRDNIRKTDARHALAALLLVALCGAAAPRSKHGPCDASHSIWGADDDPTQEISTEQFEVALARDIDKPLVIDVRSREEFAESHVPGAVDVASSAEGEVRKLVRGNVDMPLVLYGDGPFSEASGRLAEKLRSSGFTHVVRYQLGIPVWRALGHPTETDRAAIRATLAEDRTAVVIDARDRAAFQAATLPGARNVPFNDVVSASEDGRLPAGDHNTRIFVAGKDGAQALAAAQEIARASFQNVSFYGGSIQDLMR